MPNLTSPHLRNRATQTDILLAFADRLREHPLLNVQNVVVSDQAVPEDMPGGGFLVCIAPGSGNFPAELWDAASHAQATEDGSAVIGVYTKIRRDRRGRREFSLFGRRKQLSDTPEELDRPSLITWKQSILKLLTVGDPTWAHPGGAPMLDVAVEAWEPSRDGIPLCRDVPRPVSATGVLDVPGFPGWIGLQLTFSIAWDWDLYA
ncbi:hypothetical protein [Aureliella helgolandensis]|uniref:Uncharacterized protein n=1 Tax=Aureliella helgolandensis TaxID=2527968 RepID=A0A518GCN0_9BACT|nr:hypothetical protein [Aureliella helgolandensis]QDV26356.1 hypothetical protein Q31a_47290 [Aureliella helgolandensis]